MQQALWATLGKPCFCVQSVYSIKGHSAARVTCDIHLRIISSTGPFGSKSVNSCLSWFWEIVHGGLRLAHNILWIIDISNYSVIIFKCDMYLGYCSLECTLGMMDKVWKWNGFFKESISLLLQSLMQSSEVIGAAALRNRLFDCCSCCWTHWHLKPEAFSRFSALLDYDAK